MGKSNNINNYTDFFYHAFRNILIISILLVIISALILSLPHSSADNSSLDSVMLSIPTTCTLSAIIDSEHSISTLGGTYTEDIGETTMKTICNDANGFSIYAIGASGSNEGSTVLVSSLGEDYDIATGTATSGNTSNWAMKLTTDSTATYPITLDSDFNTNNYVSIPGTWTKVAHRTSGTDTATEAEAITGASLSTTYAAYITPAQPAGTYIGQVKYVLLHPDTNENFMTLEMAFDRYVGPEHKISLDGSATAPKYYRMQDMTSEICQAATTMGGGAQMQLIDDRINLDGEKRLYWVAKLADGNCWMTQNLDLDLIAGHTYTHADTDLGWNPNSFDANATWTLTGGPSTIAWDDISATFLGWRDDNVFPYSADPGEKYYYTSDSSRNCTELYHSGCRHYHVGNYYNWPSAVANNDAVLLTSGNAPNSICPSGWRLPMTTADEFVKLFVDYEVIRNIGSTSYMPDGLNKLLGNPLYFIKAGYIQGGYTRYSGSQGYSWSSSISDKSNAFGLYFRNQDIGYGGGRNPKGYGEPIRCLAR